MLVKCSKLDVNLQGHFEYNALLVAANNGGVKVLNELLKIQHLNINIQGENNWTALMHCIHGGYIDVRNYFFFIISLQKALKGGGGS